MFVCKNLVKKYKSGEGVLKALDNVSVTFEENKINTILGPSGSGKSTLLNVLSTLDYVNSGEILFMGKDISKYSEKMRTKYRRDNIGFVFQGYNLISTLTAKENVELGAYLSKDGLDVDEMLKEVGLYEHRDKYPHQLSGGQQQRVAIARVLTKNPKVIFCDEPTGALDEDSGRKVLDLLQKLTKKYGTTLIMVTHNVNIANMSHKVVHFNSGKIVKEDENTQVLGAYEIEWS